MYAVAIFLVLFGVVTPWESAGSGTWRAYLNDPQVSIAKVRVVGEQVVFSIEQKCFEEEATEKATILEWVAGEKYGRQVACNGTKYRSNRPEAVEPSLRKSDLPPEVQKLLKKKLHRDRVEEEDFSTTLQRGRRDI